MVSQHGIGSPPAAYHVMWYVQEVSPWDLTGAQPVSDQGTPEHQAAQAVRAGASPHFPQHSAWLPAPWCWAGCATVFHGPTGLLHTRRGPIGRAAPCCCCACCGCCHLMELFLWPG